jgi:hypothetical protein
MAETDGNRESEAWKTPLLRQNVRLKMYDFLGLKPLLNLMII